MDAVFHATDDSRLLRLRALLPREDAPSLRRLLVQYGLFLAAAAVLVLAPQRSWPPLCSWLAGACVALLSSAFFALGHEACHGTAFARKGLNRLAAWLVGIPIFYPPTGFRTFHFMHHRHTHEGAQDPELAFARRLVPAFTSTLPIYLSSATGLPLACGKLVLTSAAAIGVDRLWRTALWYVPERDRARFCWEARAILALHAGLLALGLTLLPGLLHVMLAVVLGHGPLALYLMAEHGELPHSPPGASALQHTRTTLTNGFVRWLMWNMPYHAEHHAFPAVPWHRLPAAHEILKAEEPHLCPGYLRFHLGLWRRYLGLNR